MRSPTPFAATVFAAAALAAAFSNHAAASCTGELTVNGKTHTFTHCALAVMPGANTSVTLLASADPLSADEVATFALSAYSSLAQRNGMPRTGLMLSFCAGGATPSAQAATRFQTSISVRDAPLLGRERALPDGQGRVEVKRLTGSTARGETLAGAIEGRIQDSDRYAFTLTWSLPVPSQEAASGLSCP